MNWSKALTLLEFPAQVRVCFVFGVSSFRDLKNSIAGQLEILLKIIQFQTAEKIAEHLRAILASGERLESNFEVRDTSDVQCVFSLKSLWTWQWPWGSRGS